MTEFFCCFNAGESWTSVAEPNLDGVFFSADSNSVYFSRPSHGYLFKSIDGGRTIAKCWGEYGKTDKNTIFDPSVDPFNGYFYAATNRGLFLSKDGGRKAEQIADDLSPHCFHCLRFDRIVDFRTIPDAEELSLQDNKSRRNLAKAI